MKYIDADRLKAEIERRRLSNRYIDTEGYESELIDIIDSLQQDEKAVEIEMCSQAYWEERGWMMIPPDVTLKGIESLLEQVRKKLQQEQPEGLHFTPLNRLIQKIPSENWNDTVNNYAKKLRDCLIEEGYRKDAEVLQGYISYMNGNNVPMATMDEQEQPEEGLDEEISRYLREDCSADDEPSVSDIARHFAEWGAEHARKEE